MKKQLFSYLTLGALVLGTTIVPSMPVSAASELYFSHTLSVGGIELITIRGETAQKVQNRTHTLEDRLVTILADSKLTASDVHVRLVRSDFAVYVKNQLLITVTPQDSAYNQNSPERQAQIWQKQLAKTLPLVKVTPQTL